MPSSRSPDLEFGFFGQRFKLLGLSSQINNVLHDQNVNMACSRAVEESRIMFKYSRIAAFCVFSAFAVSIGCGPEVRARAVVNGKVSIDGKNLTTGMVTFSSKDNRFHGSAPIDANGSYTMNDAPVGEVTVQVAVQRPIAAMPGMPGASGTAPKGMVMKSPDGSMEMATVQAKKIDPSKVVVIPEKYSNPSTSGLTYTVGSGNSTFDIKLTK